MDTTPFEDISECQTLDAMLHQKIVYLQLLQGVVVAAEETRARLAAILESSDGAITGTALDGTLVDWNTGAERIYGYRRDEVNGRPIAMLVPADRPHEIPEILERIRAG